MTTILRRLLGLDEPERYENGTPPSDAAKAYEQARREAEQRIQAAERDTRRIENRPSWETLFRQMEDR